MCICICKCVGPLRGKGPRYIKMQLNSTSSEPKQYQGFLPSSTGWHPLRRPSRPERIPPIPVLGSWFRNFRSGLMVHQDRVCAWEQRVWIFCLPGGELAQGPDNPSNKTDPARTSEVQNYQTSAGLKKLAVDRMGQQIGNIVWPQQNLVLVSRENETMQVNNFDVHIGQKVSFTGESNIWPGR